jgi:hypothetical protein
MVRLQLILFSKMKMTGAFFCRTFGVFLHVPTTQIYCLTGAIISETHAYNEYIFKYYARSSTKALFYFILPSTGTRETREGWPLLTVETEANRDSHSTNERGPSLVGLLGSSCRYTRLLPCPGCSGQPSTNFFLHHTLFQFICRHRQSTLAGSRAGPPVSECVCLRLEMLHHRCVTLTLRGCEGV